MPFVHGYDFQRPELDCSILFGDGHWPGARSHYLAGQDVALIAPRPGLAEVPIRSPQDVARCTLLRHVTVPQAWLQWREAHGVRGLDPLAGRREAQALAHALEKRRAGPALQFLYLLAHGALRQVQGLGRARDAAKAGGGGERAQQVQGRIELAHG